MRSRRFGSISASGTGSSYADQPRFDRTPSPLSGTTASARAGDAATLVALDEVVLAVPEEHEVVVEQPLEERDGVRDLLVGVERRPGLSDRDHAPRGFLHRGEVADGQSHVAQDLARRLLEVGRLV